MRGEEEKDWAQPDMSAMISKLPRPVCADPLAGHDLAWHVIKGKGDKIEEWGKNKEANGEIVSMPG